MNHSQSFIPFVVAAASCVLAGHSHSQTVSNWTYNGTTAANLGWDSATSWSAGIPDAAGDTANFDFNLTAARIITLNADRTVGNLTIGDPAAAYFAYTISAGSPVGRLVLDQTGTADATISLPVTASLGANVISAGILLNDNLVIDAQQIFTTAAALSLNGIIDDGAGSFSITKNGPSIITLAGNNTFDGGLTINAGRVGASSAGAFGTGPVTVADGGQAYLTVASGIYPNNFTLNGIGITETAGQLGALRIQSGASVTGSITLAGDTRITAQGSTGTLTGNIGESTPGRSLELANLSTSANSTIRVSGTNSFTGGADIRGAIVIGDSNTAFGSGSIYVTGNGTAARVTRLQLGTNITIGNSIILDSTAQTDSRGALFSYAGDLVTPSVATVNGEVTVSAAVGNGGHFGSEAGSASVLRIMGPIISQNSIIPQMGIGTVELGGGGIYPQLNALQGTLRLAADQGIAPDALLSLSGSGATVFDLNGHDQKLGGLTKAANAAAVANLGATPSLLTLALPEDSAYAGTFDAGTAALSVVKSGAGILTLSGGSTTFDGSMQVNEGGLNLTGTFGGATSSAAFSSGTVLRGEGVFGGALNLGSATIDVNGATPAGLLAGGNLSASTVSVKLTGLPATSAPIAVLGYGGSFGGSPANFTLVNSGSYRTPSFLTGGGAVTLTLGAPVTLIWTGAGGNSNWDLNTTANWQDPSTTPGNFFIADHAAFGDAPVGDQVITLPADVLATDLRFTNSLRSYTFTGSGILAASTLAKSGTGTVTFANPLDITGSISHNGGTLRFAPGTAATTTLSAPLSGTGTLIKAGEGRVLLSGASASFSGPVVISSGELGAGHADALGTGTLEFGDAATLPGDTCTLTVGDAVTITGKSATITPQAANAKIGTLGGSIANASILKLGTGTLKIGHRDTLGSAVNALSGTSSVVVVQGTLGFDSRTPLSATSTVTLGTASTGTAPTVIEVPPATAADQSVWGAAVVLSPDAPASPATINFPGKAGDGGSPNFGGTIALNGRDLIIGNTSHLDPGVTARLYNLSSLISGQGNVRVRTGTNPDGTLNPVARARIMNTANTWSGDLFVETGMVQIGNGNVGNAYNAIPNTAVVHLSAGTRIGMGSSGDTFAGLSGGAAAGVLPPAQLNPNVSGSGTSRITLAGPGDHVFGGTLDNESGSTTRILALTKSGPGTQTLDGDCTFTGSTLLTGGTLTINGSYASAITMSAGTGLQGTPASTAALTATAAGAVLSPGNSTGAMSFASANLSTGGVLEIEINDSSTPRSDSIHTTGVLNVTGTTLNLVLSGTPAAPAYVIASYGTLTGTFGTVNGLPPGYKLAYDYNNGTGGNHIALVTVTADPYASWLAAYPSITGADRSPDADFDKDGLPNGIEFVIESNPTIATSTGLPSGTVSGGNFLFSFKRGDASKAFTVTVESGTTLALWPVQTVIPTTAVAGPPVTVVENGAAADDVTVALPTAGNPERFARLKVEIPFTP